MRKFGVVALLLMVNSGWADSFTLTESQARRFIEYTNYAEDVEFWRAVISAGATNFTEQTFSEHLSIDGRQEISHHFSYDEHISSDLLNRLADCAIAYVRRCEEFLEDPVNAEKLKSKAEFKRALVHWQFGFLERMATRLEIDRSLAEKLFQEVEPPNFWVGRALARNPNTPQDILEDLSRKEFGLAFDLAMNPNAPTNVLWRLLTNENFEQARVALASRTTTDARFLWQWATNGDQQVRIAVGRNTNAPSALLLQLAKETNAEVRLAASFGLARSPNTPLSILQDLARNGGPDVQIAVARNPSASMEVLEEVLNNPLYRVWIEAFRVLASQNPAPKELLRKRLQAADNIERRWFKDEKGLADWVYREL